MSNRKALRRTKIMITAPRSGMPCPLYLIRGLVNMMKNRYSRCCLHFAAGITLFFIFFCNLIAMFSSPAQLISKWSSTVTLQESLVEFSRKFTVVHSTTNYHYSTSKRFEIIILTYNRPVSLLRCLKSCRRAEYYGHNVDLTIWIDRSVDGRVDAAVQTTATGFFWPHGSMAVNVWDQHVGLFGQWIDTFTAENDDDFAVILEDDLEVSPLFYKWIVGARSTYAHRSDIFGYTLQRGTLRARPKGLKSSLSIDPLEKAFLYLLVGSWGYAPNSKEWRNFRNWFHKMSHDPTFKPYVENLKPTEWYRGQEKRKTMWTMWHIRYADENRLYTVYSNLDNKKTLASNWREPGLHFRGGVEGRDGRRDFSLLEKGIMGEESGNFSFPSVPVLVDWNGTYINRNGSRTLI